MPAALTPATDGHLSRRSFLRVAATAAGGLLVALYCDLPSTAQEGALPKPKIYPPDAFVNIQSDGKIVIQVNRLEFGQGVHTALPMILADELDADWSQVVPELAPAADVYRDPLSNIQMVGGSGSIAHSFQQYRELGARARMMLVAAAAARWQVPPEQCRTASSIVHGPSGQSLAYGDLAAEAARQPLPATVQLKNPRNTPTARSCGRCTKNSRALPATSRWPMRISSARQLRSPSACAAPPVKLIWTREDDVRGGYYRPMHLHRVEVGIGADGLPAAWRHVIVGQSILVGTPFAAFLIQNGVDATAVEGVVDTPYTLANFYVSAHHPTPNVPVLWWRSVGHTHSAFVMETLIDELATRAGLDPIAYRRQLLKPEAKKLRATLDLLEAKSTPWRRNLPPGHAVGIACHESFGTGVACAVDVSIQNQRPKIHRATVAVDAGMAVNPLTIESQCQGGLAFGVSQLMAQGAITFKDGVVEQSNFDGYTPPYISDAPVAVDVHIVPSAEHPTGCGEPPVPVISPAVVNALTQLTGKRYRRLPLVAL